MTNGRAVHWRHSIPPAPVATYTVYGLISEDTAAGPVPVQGALVALSTSSQRAVTDSTGTYRIAGVSAAKATVLVTRWGFLANNTAVEIAGDTQRDIQITRAPSFTLYGIVYEMTASGRVPVPGVSVYCDSCGSPDGHTFATTDSEGAYRFDWAINDATPLVVSKAATGWPQSPVRESSRPSMATPASTLSSSGSDLITKPGSRREHVMKSSNRKWYICVVVALCGLSVNAAPARADIVLDWNATMASVINVPPFPGARFAAITQLAVFEAVNAITGEYTPYLGTIVAPSGASPEAAAAAAAHRVLRTYFGSQAAAIDAVYVASLAGIADGQAKIDGIATGEAAAAAMIALRSNDGSAPAQSYLPSTSDPGQWQLTAGCSATGGSFRQWGSVTTFALQDAAQFRPGPPPLLTSGEYRKDFIELVEVGGIDSALRLQDRTDVALFYARLSPVSWANSAARQIAATQGGSLSQNARAFALLNMALSDAAVATFEAKYYYTFWRPETAIHNADADGNAKTDG